MSPRYRTIVADPPWQYASAATKADARKHYSTMSLAEIADLDVPGMAAESCHLWLWTTNAFLEDAYWLVRSWRFVEQVSPAPWLEMFSRRARFGWSTWGNESLEGGEAA